MSSMTTSTSPRAKTRRISSPFAASETRWFSRAQIGRQGLPPDRVILHDQDVMGHCRSRRAGFSLEARHSYPFTIFYATFIDGANARLRRWAINAAGSRSGSIGRVESTGLGEKDLDADRGRRPWRDRRRHRLGRVQHGHGGHQQHSTSASPVMRCATPSTRSTRPPSTTRIRRRAGGLSRLPRAEGLDPQGHSQGPGVQRALAQDRSARSTRRRSSRRRGLRSPRTSGRR